MICHLNFWLSRFCPLNCPGHPQRGSPLPASSSSGGPRLPRHLLPQGLLAGDPPSPMCPWLSPSTQHGSHCLSFCQCRQTPPLRLGFPFWHPLPTHSPASLLKAFATVTPWPPPPMDIPPLPSLLMRGQLISALQSPQPSTPTSCVSEMTPCPSFTEKTAGLVLHHQSPGLPTHPTPSSTVTTRLCPSLPPASPPLAVG